MFIYLILLLNTLSYNLCIIDFVHIIKAVKNSLVGPVNAGTAVNLNCVVVGGQPPPAVLWYR